MAFAIHIKTESGDDYVFALDGTPTKKEIIAHLKKQLMDEYNYISEYHYDSTYEIKFKMNTC